MPESFVLMRLATLPSAFDHEDFLFEVKYDGFRALAIVERRAGATLISRTGKPYKSFSHLSDAIATALEGHHAILDGEIVHFGEDGRPLFFDLLRRRSPEHFCAFDLLSLDGRDLRIEPLLERKRLLKALIPPQPCTLVYVDHLEANGRLLFEHCCGLDLEGIVAKHKGARYQMSGPFSVAGRHTSWAKIRNTNYSQWHGRRE